MDLDRIRGLLSRESGERDVISIWANEAFKATGRDLTTYNGFKTVYKVFRYGDFRDFAMEPDQILSLLRSETREKGLTFFSHTSDQNKALD